MPRYLSNQLPKPVISVIGGAKRKQGHLFIDDNRYIQINSG